MYSFLCSVAVSLKPSTAESGARGTGWYELCSTYAIICARICDVCPLNFKLRMLDLLKLSTQIRSLSSRHHHHRIWKCHGPV